MSGYGKGTDFFGLATEGETYYDADLTLIRSSTTPAPTSVVAVEDEDGNNAGEGTHAGDGATKITCEYKLNNPGGSIDLSTLKLGPATINSIEVLFANIKVDTTNTDWPTITCEGYTAITNNSEMPNFTFPSLTINAKKQAQELDFTTGANCKLNSSSLEFKGEYHYDLDEDGNVQGMAFTGGELDLSADFVEIDGACSWTLGGTWTETQAPGIESENIGWAKTSGTAHKRIAKDA